jgi:hypothetical protein
MLPRKGPRLVLHSIRLISQALSRTWNSPMKHRKVRHIPDWIRRRGERSLDRAWRDEYKKRDQWLHNSGLEYRSCFLLASGAKPTRHDVQGFRRHPER